MSRYVKAFVLGIYGRGRSDLWPLFDSCGFELKLVQKEDFVFFFGKDYGKKDTQLCEGLRQKACFFSRFAFLKDAFFLGCLRL